MISGSTLEVLKEVLTEPILGKSEHNELENHHFSWKNDRKTMGKW